MDKRTKILLAVLGALIVSGGAYFGYITMKAKDAVQEAKLTAPLPKNTPMAVPSPSPATPSVVVAPPAGQVAAVAPAPASPAPSVASGPVPPPGQPKTAVKTAQTLTTAAKTQATPPPAVAAKTPVPPAPYVAVLRVVENGKPVEYKNPEDLLAKTTMSPSETRDFSKRTLDEAKKAYDAASKKADKAAIDHADKDLKLSGRLAELVKAKLPEAVVAEAGKAGTYVSLGKRDPFMSPLQIPKVYPPIQADAGPLERKGTEDMRVNAIMWTDKGYRALILTPDERGYTVRVGDIVGNKKGKVTKITKDKVYVVEMIKDILGDVHKMEHTLKLHKEAE